MFVSKDLLVNVVDHIAVVEIRRPPANYFDHDLLARIADAGEELQSGREARVIVLCSEGKHFCAGADFGAGPLSDDRERAAADLYEQGSRIFDLELPIVAAVQGSAVGGGLGLACAADFRVASPQSRFHGNFAGLGFHHGFGLSVTLPRIVGAQNALDLLVTSRRIDGDQAYAMGLVDRLAPTGDERLVAMDLATGIAALAPLAVRAIKRTQRAGVAEQVRSALRHELSEQNRLWQTADSKIGIAASLSREVAQFTGE
jgi:enoyl-CoA hydratase/carnithine racemase